MQKFDCLALDCPLFGPHLLEASAGTGKTFSIEHIFVRLILEGVEVEQILAVTFTRAATRELKARIRSNLEAALCNIKSGESSWHYLQPHFGSPQSTQALTDALACFDQCQIFTIHGFCYRMLKEFAFEANVSSLSNPDEGKKIPEVLQLAARDFLEHGIDPSLLCTEQLSLLFKEFDSMDSIAEKLLELKEFAPSLSFSEISAKCKAALHGWTLEEDKLMADFRALEKNFKAMKGNFEIQVRALADMDLFPALLKEKGSLFDFLDRENRKVRAEEPKFLNYPGFFEWARNHIAPLVKQKVFPVLQKAFQPIAEKILAEADHFDPDEILIKMRKSMENPRFKERVQKKYEAAIIDEFQDTDAVQWEIFQHLFFDPPLKALYLVGDPKQSIYRFRKADIYTYLAARHFLGEQNSYLLDTNFRSSKSLIGALNALFNREWLHLPKTNSTLPYYPVQAGAKIETDFTDGKGAVHFMIAEGESLFEEAFLPYAVREIEKLQCKRCAILVKDRYQAEKALDCLKKRGIAAVAKSHTPLGKTNAFKAINELFDAVLHPHDQNAANIVMAGPFAKPDLYLPEMKTLLEEKGLVSFAKEFALDSDAMQIFEHLFAWEKNEGFSFEGLGRFLEHLKHLDPEEGASRRMEVDEEAVQIMTLHISKGLEFDVVFALGLATRTPQSEDAAELNAEKMRQLYVAMTRAKKRLYVPIAFSKKEAASGAHSPIELFSQYFEGSFVEQIKILSQTESISHETLSPPLDFAPLALSKKAMISKPISKPRSYEFSILSSFTTLARTKESEVEWTDPDCTQFTLQTMPRGSETGIAIHALFEAIFSSPKPVWRDLGAIDAILAEQLQHSPLEPWQKAIQQMVRQTLSMPLQGEEEWFTLSEIDRFQVETEFVFPTPPDFVKGFIDLIFQRKNKMYLIDWKTNWLENYEPDSLKKAMDTHDYDLQATLYAEAIRRHFKAELGGAYYVFVRGGTWISADFGIQYRHLSKKANPET
ncbi:MAG: UvrD-helicase domain-containing protein [Parachlamydiales bacterium]|nr:UvrD-helicase domain-containing protein [Parachlamydiales bacterium]